MQAVIWRLIALINQRIVAIDHFHRRISWIQRREVGVVVPQLRARSPNVRNKLIGIAFMKIAHRRGEHHDVTRGK